MILATGMGVYRLDHSFERQQGFPWWLIGALLRGRTKLETRGHVIVLPRRHLGLMRPRVPYRVSFGGGDTTWEDCWVMFRPRPEWSDLLGWPEVVPGYMGLPAADGAAHQAQEALLDAHRFFASAEVDRERLAVNALERALLLANRANPVRARRGHPAVQIAIETIHARADEPLTVAELARLARCSPSHLAHLFSAETGTSPRAYLEQARIARAKHLLVSTAMPVQEIAASVGFDSPGHFSTRFRRCVGVTPLDYRRAPSAGT